ncbi:hypothetical protein [Xanthomonas fragariae]|uniref:hypothetical protein n=1 Tax=Xanthomonas fragariae TaxID=48664 RepID=UPI00138AB9D2|nr:hypothetical protein [Xanthomonas fragariae]MBL9196852.1 hypothetical protein [Xanthomonas fragariae]MBL9221251.1 hypothetical protein [Xanthomonas fragariae]
MSAIAMAIIRDPAASKDIAQEAFSASSPMAMRPAALRHVVLLVWSHWQPPWFVAARLYSTSINAGASASMLVLCAGIAVLNYQPSGSCHVLCTPAETQCATTRHYTCAVALPLHVGSGCDAGEHGGSHAAHPSSLHEAGNAVT